VKILFVDDELNILSGLKRMLHQMSDEWDMYFEDSGQKALQLLEKIDIDLIVTDMKMPGMDGLTLLDYINEKYPHIVRIILTGHTDEEYILKSVRTSHQFILKPCTQKELVTRIKKIYKLKRYLISEEIKDIIATVERIPALPENYLRLEKELNAQEPSLSKICSIIEKEPGLSAKILQIVNSAYFNLPATVYDIQQALNILGINSIRSIVLYSEIFQKTPPLKTKLFSIESLWKHSMFIANASKVIYELITKDKITAKHAYIAGLLHDIGYLITSQVEGYDENITYYMENEGVDKYEAEEKFLKISHAQVGAYLLSVWNLPEPIIDAVALHHEPIDNILQLKFEGAIYLAQLWEKDPVEFNGMVQEKIDENLLKKMKNELTSLSTSILV